MKRDTETEIPAGETILPDHLVSVYRCRQDPDCCPGGYRIYIYEGTDDTAPVGMAPHEVPLMIAALQRALAVCMPAPLPAPAPS